MLILFWTWANNSLLSIQGVFLWCVVAKHHMPYWVSVMASGELQRQLHWSAPEELSDPEADYGKYSDHLSCPCLPRRIDEEMTWGCAKLMTRGQYMSFFDLLQLKTAC